MSENAGSHAGWNDLVRRVKGSGLSRRRFLQTAAAAAAGAALSPLTRLGIARSEGVGPATPGIGLPDSAAWPTTNPLKHIVVLCQENRSFDHYFGMFAAAELGTTGNRAEVFDPETPYYTTDGTRSAKPFHIEIFCDDDPGHGWSGSHDKWNGGLMDGWVKAEDDTTRAIGYYDAPDHIYHLQLAQAFTMCDHYFCSQIGPTLPNRLYLWSGTSGWGHLPLSSTGSVPFNNPPISQAPPVFSWPTMPDVLEGAGIPWKCYTVGDGSLPSPIGAFNPLIFFSQIQSSPTMAAKALAPIDQFFIDLATGKLPAVSWIITEATVSEHPPAPPDMGQLLAARVVRSLMESTAWDSSALILTYDEGGGYFDHVPPPVFEVVPSGPFAGEAIGPAFRVPATIVSPWARRRSVFKGALDHTSVLALIERTFNLPQTLEIAPGRRNGLADMRDAFDFTQTPTRPALPAPEDLFKLANETVLTVDVHRGIVECGTMVPRWLPPLLGQEPLIPYPYPTPS